MIAILELVRCLHCTEHHVMRNAGSILSFIWVDSISSITATMYIAWHHESSFLRVLFGYKKHDDRVVHLNTGQKVEFLSKIVLVKDARGTMEHNWSICCRHLYHNMQFYCVHGLFSFFCLVSTYSVLGWLEDYGLQHIVWFANYWIVFCSSVFSYLLLSYYTLCCWNESYYCFGSILLSHFIYHLQLLLSLRNLVVRRTMDLYSSVLSKDLRMQHP